MPLKPLNSGRGGARKGAGRPKGSKNPATITKEQAREALREYVKERMAELVSAQVANAIGIKYLVVRDAKTGKFLRVSEALAREKLKSGEEIVEVWEKDPSVQAFTDLMNRTIDKPAEQVDANVTGNLAMRITWETSE
jgi:hypothetical protein